MIDFDVFSRHSRRDTLKGLVAGGAMILGIKGFGHMGFFAEEVTGAAQALEKLGWTVACQLYTFRRFPFYEAIEKIAALGIKAVEPCFFLALDKGQPGLVTSEALTPEKRAEMKQRLARLGMTMPNFYANVGGDAEQAKKVFAFAKEMGCQTIVAEPPPEALPMLDELLAEYGLRLAIHNHPKSPQSRYWHPKNVLEAVRDRSERIGACCDTGHWVRSGLDPVECLKMMEGRVITLHLKDVAEVGVVEARDVPLGTGAAKYDLVLQELARQKFRGVLPIEYEHDSPQLEEDVAACRDFVLGWAAKNVS
ncbi:MAG: sugar phosphate isomerase/epimerase family protein [Thermogutta sp.]